jgi:hypothetical protein
MEGQESFRIASLGCIRSPLHTALQLPYNLGGCLSALTEDRCSYKVPVPSSS